MSDLTYVVPAKGRLVRDDRTNLPVPPEGMFVPSDAPHWHACIKFGDVTVIEAPKAAVPPPKAAVKTGE